MSNNIIQRVFPILRGRCRVMGVHEHTRTIGGKKDSLGQAVLTHVSLGWFIHTDLDDGGISFCYGPERPSVQPGDILELTLSKVEPSGA